MSWEICVHFSISLIIVILKVTIIMITIINDNYNDDSNNSDDSNNNTLGIFCLTTTVFLFIHDILR